MEDGTLSDGEARFLNRHTDDARFPPPPYQFADGHMIFIGARFAPAVVRDLLPPDLEPTSDGSGVFCSYEVGSGGGLAGFSATYVALEVKGFDAPDGSSAYYIVAGYYSEPGLRFMRERYNVNPLAGGSRWYEDAGTVVGQGGPPGIDAVTLRMRRGAERPERWSGVHHYAGLAPVGGSCVFPIGFHLRAIDGAAISVDIADTADERWRRLRPESLTYALECADVSLTFSVPQPVAGSPELTVAGDQVALLQAFSRMGRPAILAGADADIVAITPEAEALLGDGLYVQSGRLRAKTPAVQAALEAMIAAGAVSGGGAGRLSPIALRRENGQALIVEAMPASTLAAGRVTTLLLLNDPARPTGDATHTTLQLLGLTPAEARIAGRVGSGLSPREAAEELQLSLNTVRSALKIAFDKLGISRQAELAKIVARLAG